MSTVQVSAPLDNLLGRLPAAGRVAVVRDGPSMVIALRPVGAIRADGPDALAALDTLDAGWWAGFCAYDLGRAIERVPDRNPPSGLPDLHLVRFDVRIRIDPDGAITIEGEGHDPDGLLTPRRPTVPPQLGPWRSSFDAHGWEGAVTRILQHLRDGDCYQVNLTRRLEAEATTDPTQLFRALAREHPAPYAALLRFDDVAVVSASPECFLRRDGRAITTRPIKGTSADPHALPNSAKDRAENVMIVDLARNDLGRICEYGTIAVPALFELEQHPGLFHLVSTVTGTLRPEVTVGDVFRATFPPASVTGCPKPRVLDIIETLEPSRRGVYCGAIGFVDADRDVMDFNVAIRTFTFAHGTVSFGVGGGIVADSDPRAEWEETELKARRLLAVARGAGSRGHGAQL
ncbi:MAG: anthranilate synthase component I family protein [Actinomycetota bacterium]